MNKSFNKKTRHGSTQKKSGIRNSGKDEFLRKGDGYNRGDNTSFVGKQACHPTNDASWYIPNEQMLKDVASLPFHNLAGLAYPFGDLEEHSVPGIYIQDLVQAVGSTNYKGTYSNLTVGARNFYTFIRHANSGSANYEAPDLMMYIIGHCSIQSYISNLKRIYRVAMTYSARNRYLAERLVNMLGFNYDNLISNMANLRYAINLAITRLNALKVPADIPLAKRWTYVSEAMFCDSTAPRSQLYAYNFVNYYILDVSNPDIGTQLKPYNPWTAGFADSQLLTVTQVESTLSAMLDAIEAEETFGIMSGDIMKAYQDKVSNVALLEATEYVVPLVDEEALTQLHNARNYVKANLVYGDPYGAPTQVDTTITQANGEIISIPKFQRVLLSANIHGDSITDAIDASKWTGFTAKFDLNFFHSDVSPSDVIVATRLMPIIRSHTTGEDNQFVYVQACGTEIPVGVRVYGFFTIDVYPDLDNNGYSTYQYFVGVDIATTDDTNIQPVYDAAAIQAAFRFAAGFICVKRDPDRNNMLVGARSVRNYENYTTVDGSVLAGQHAISVLNEVGSSILTKF